MNRYRTFLSVALGLVLLLQGLAVSAAPHVWAQERGSTVSVAATGMPCHAQAGDATDAQAAPLEGPCCNAACPDMTSCALSHMAVSLPAAVTRLSAASVLFTGLEPVPVSQPPRSLLRPPIPLHA